ncbi:kazrin-like [Trichosurus vulpecula]|uniref:kazrin-like n=1 Tax=Trichosurus vulpecula TaxID=9337 RepID=UPI00186AF328|nr:kazrin-like [Trichosurus vulpecula]
MWGLLGHLSSPSSHIPGRGGSRRLSDVYVQGANRFVPGSSAPWVTSGCLSSQEGAGSTSGIREAERFGTPPGRASSITRQGKEETSSSVKYKTGRLPLGKIGRGFSSKDLDFHDDYGSLRNEDCFDDDPQDRPDQCRLENYSGLEVTNV